MSFQGSGYDMPEELNKPLEQEQQAAADAGFSPEVMENLQEAEAEDAALGTGFRQISTELLQEVHDAVEGMDDGIVKEVFDKIEEVIGNIKDTIEDIMEVFDSGRDSGDEESDESDEVPPEETSDSADEVLNWFESRETAEESEAAEEAGDNQEAEEFPQPSEETSDSAEEETSQPSEEAEETQPEEASDQAPAEETEPTEEDEAYTETEPYPETTVPNEETAPSEVPEQYEETEPSEPAEQTDDAGDDAAELQRNIESAASVWHIQTEDYSCAVACQQFIINEFADASVSEQELIAVATENGWYDPEGGTMTSDVGNLLDLYGIQNDITWGGTFEDLEQAVEGGNRAIVAVQNMALITEWCDGYPMASANHAIEVVAIDRSDPNDVKVIVNDPGYYNGCARAVSYDNFMDAWQTSGGYIMTAHTS